MLALTAAPASAPALKGIVGLEEARILFGTSAAAGMASTVASLVSGSAGVLLVDGRPDLLEIDIASRAAMTLLTRTGNILALERVATIISASPRQHGRMARLSETEAIIALRGAAPVMISLPNCS
jgi:hypothetical protein